MSATDIKKQLVISPIHQTLMVGKIWMGLEYDRIIKALKVMSPKGLDVEIIPFEDLADALETLDQGAYIFYSASYDPQYQQYVSDTVLHIHFTRPDLRLIPDAASLLCFENKGFQEHYRLNKDITNLWGKYFGDIADFDQERYNNFPYVVKKRGGALSSGVTLCHNYQELKEFIGEPKIGLKQKIKYKLRSKKANPEFSYQNEEFMLRNREKFFSFRQGFVIQEYIEGLTCDYKVLVFGEAYYVFKRFVRDGDFRASGSGKFIWERPSDKVLNFAKTVFEKMDVPFVALDIAESDMDCYLLELQAIGFGPIGQDKSDRYYFWKGGWQEKEEKPDLELTYARALDWFMQKHS